MTANEKSERKAGRAMLADVPVFSAVAVRTLQLVSKERGQLQELSELIASDPAISSGILRMANSALFGARVEIRGILQAIHLLGLERVKGAVVTVAMTTYLGASLEVPALRACWRHSLACAVIAQELARISLMESDVAYTAGLMHDVGRLALVAGYPGEYADFLASTEQEPCDVPQRERDLFGIDHCQAGLLLVTRWNLPELFRSVTSRHHDPAAVGEPPELSVVRHGCEIAEALGFNVARSNHSRSYEEIRKELPERGRSRLPREASELSNFIASRINSIECA